METQQTDSPVQYRFCASTKEFSLLAQLELQFESRRAVPGREQHWAESQSESGKRLQRLNSSRIIAAAPQKAPTS
eukprot:605542-Prorocentrum_minimum.AAC.2